MNGTGNEALIGAETVPVNGEKFRDAVAENTSAVSAIPTDPKVFEAWLDLNYPYWPVALTLRANRALLSLKSREQKAWDQSFALRKAAKAAKSAAEVPRRATAEEIALAETQRQPNHCTAYSSRTGLPCEANKLHGSQVCRVHGASAPQVKAKAKQRYLEEVEPTLNRIVELRDQSEHLPTAMKAADHLMDRALGPLRSGTHEGTSGPTINIGIALGGLTAPNVELAPLEVIDAENIREIDDSEEN
jgi:hypothetical protein